ncbi:MAG: AsmA-like C-terminal region-containing protein, partial [Desulfobacterales bacterium]
NYRSADSRRKRLEIGEARLWNIPGEPERIEAQGSTKGMAFNIRLNADSPAELSGPQNPWSLELIIEGPDMSLAIAGQMQQAFKWEQGDYRIEIRGNQADSLESLFDVAFPTSGPFEFSANVNKTEGAFRMTDISARLQGPPETHALEIKDGAVSGGQDEPLQLALEGLFDDLPFSLAFASKPPIEGISQTTPWPMEAELNIAETKLNLDGAIIPAKVAESFEFDVRLQGENLNILAQFLDAELPVVGPYEFSFKAQMKDGNYMFKGLEGSIERPGPWKMLRIDQGSASANEKGSVTASIDAKLDTVPLSLTFNGGSETSEEAGQKAWPLKFKASASGATLTGNGAVVKIENETVLQIEARISGNRFESLSPLVGSSLPAIGRYNLSAELSSDGDVHEARNIKVQMGNNRLSGSARWEEKQPRPLLTGNLSTKHLNLSEFAASSKTASKRSSAGPLDHPITLEGLNAFDAKMDLTVKSVANMPLPVTDIKSSVRLKNGKLSVPFRANLAGAPANGQIQLQRRNNVPAVELKTKIGRVDVAQALQQLDIPQIITGTADAINLEGNSSGKTLRALLDRANFTLQVSPARLNYTTEIVNQTVAVQIENVALATRKDRSLAGNFSGTLQGNAFNAEVGTTNLMKIREADISLPVQIALQTAEVQFQAAGTVERPFKNNAFELTYDLTGKEIEELDPLVDFTVPLRGAFRARGRITGNGNRFTFEEDLRVGKSDLKADIFVLKGPPRPKISGSIIADLIHLDDIDLFDVNKDTAPARNKTHVIPEYTLPVDALLSADMDLDIKIKRIDAGLEDIGDFGDLVSKVNLKDGRFKSSTQATGLTGARMSSEFELNAAVNPPMTGLQITAQELDYGLLLYRMGVTHLLEGRINLYVDLKGPGATRREFLGNADGRISVIGGPGRISSRMVDLWAADLITTMLSPSWQRESVTEINCFVTHIDLNDGLAEVDDLLLDTQRITIAGSGVLNLNTEELKVIIAPRPKRASLVSLANPVRIEGTLAAPEVSVTRLPRGRRLAGAGASLFAGLINPAFLIFTFSDTGTGRANSCDTAVERAYEALEAGSQ